MYVSFCCTGDWAAAGERDAARPGADDEEDGDAFGEFEDLETGTTLSAVLILHSVVPVPYLTS